MDIDSFWEYENPALSEERFRSALSQTQGNERLELLTQIARTYSLRHRFDDAHTLLNEVEPLLDESSVRPTIRYFLERGRTHNSAKETLKARTCFIQGWKQAQDSGEIGLAVDAAHMVAITYTGNLEAVMWNQKALSLARNSDDPKSKALIPALLNNTAWDLHNMAKFEEALVYFYEAEKEWLARAKPKQIHIAKWSVARCLRSLECHKEALDILFALESTCSEKNEPSGYVYEELAENLLAQGDTDKAKVFFNKAYEELKKDEWFAINEKLRLDRLLLLANHKS